MFEPLLSSTSASPIPVRFCAPAGLDSLEDLNASARAFAAASDFTGQPGRLLLLPGEGGGVAQVLCGANPGQLREAVRGLPSRLPAGDYVLQPPTGELAAEDAALAWAQGAYQFDRYKAERKPVRARLVVTDGTDLDAVRRLAQACALARDMVNTPASDMGPRQIETVAREIAEAFGAEITIVAGEALLDAGYPAVHAVGRAAAADRAPRMIEIAWSGPGAGAEAPLIALIGKGVTFDTGGLDLKPSAGMRLMKKDMGGAAHALALAQLVMGGALPVRLTVLIPAVENAVSGDAMRPGDVLATRAGLSVEVGNTDAEGRLILADALTRAAELSPDLTVDLATLTGAARTALGPEVVPFYTADEALAGELAQASAAVGDPLWRMPLWERYARALDSDVADLKNDPDAWAQAGSVTAALFLQRFAPKSGSWAHFDIYAWCAKSEPGRPVGGEAQAIRAVFHLLKGRYLAAGASDAGR